MELTSRGPGATQVSAVFFFPPYVAMLGTCVEPGIREFQLFKDSAAIWDRPLMVFMRSTGHQAKGADPGRAELSHREELTIESCWPESVLPGSLLGFWQPDFSFLAPPKVAARDTSELIRV